MSLARPDRITILLVDDHRVVRAGLRALLAAPEFEVVGEAASGNEAIALAVRLVPDVVLMDFEMPVVDGISATRAIRAAWPEARVVVLTTFETEADVARARDSGAVGCVAKDAPRGAIVEAIRAAVTGMSFGAFKA